MRKGQTDAEQVIWHLLRGRQIAEAKFRRQHPVGRYILDFYCDEHKLAVELDGGQHGEQADYDQVRTDFLDARGIRVLRFWNNQILQETEAVMEAIWQALQPSPQPASGRGSSRSLPPQAGEGLGMRAAFVSTNSITQGEQVGALWGWLLAQGVRIHFAHRTFQWSNEARGMAAVHCVIIGFYLPSRLSPCPLPTCGERVPGRAGEGQEGEPKKTIYEYEDIRGEPHAVAAKNINPYLVDAPDVVLTNRQHPICAVPEIGIGNKPIDGGHYLFTPEEKAEFLKREPKAEKWFRRWIGADEFINGHERWCLWLGDCPPDELRRMPEAMKRVEAVRELRLASKSAPTQKLAATPTRFHVENIPGAPYLVIPEVSSERRRFIPIGFMQPDTLSSNLVKVIPHATLYHFGILTSTMHMAWVRYTCGRLKSDYRYSAGIVYNNFPWPENSVRPEPVEGQRAVHASTSSARTGKEGAVEAAAQAVLDARAQYMLPSPPAPLAGEGNLLPSPASGGRVGDEGERVSAANSASLADLYDPLTVPPALVKAHQALDRAVDTCYRKAVFANDAQRVEFLFERYQQLTSLLPAEKKTAKRKLKT
ncbi:MAG: DNA methyltransferase [Gallionellaceae bacterium]|nr:MAG: DNA methyltransferase [Gallionellaceae bacterium]